MSTQVANFRGEQELQSPPELGDLGGKITSDANQETYVYTVANFRGEQELQSPPELGDLGGEKDLDVHRR